MARKFFFVCAGILCLMASYQLGTLRAEAQSGATAIVAMDHAGWVLDNQGRVWNVGHQGVPWERTPVWDPPVPVSQIAHWGVWAVVTTDGVGWWHDASTWHNAGAFPGGPIAVEQESAGSVKGKYRR